MMNTLRAITLAVFVVASGEAWADDYPSRTIRLIVPYPAGGGVDILARALSKELSIRFNQPVIVENKPGANTVIGATYVARSGPDGYTLLFTSDSTITSNPHMYKSMTYDPIKDFDPITSLIVAPQIVAAHSSLKVSGLIEMVNLAKQDTRSLSYASYGNGSQPYLFFEALNAKTGAHFLQVPYRGAAPALQAVVAGEVQTSLLPLALSIPYIENGGMRPLALGRAERVKSLPNVPTLGELGLSDVYPFTWFGLFAPAGTPKSVILTIHKNVSAVFSELEFRNRHVIKIGYDLAIRSPDAFVKFIQQDFASKGTFFKMSGLRPE